MAGGRRARSQGNTATSSMPGVRPYELRQQQDAVKHANDQSATPADSEIKLSSATRCYVDMVR
jgi:hypothetical protein